MCFHDKPTRNDEQRGYDAALFGPTLKEGDQLLYDECGRCGPLGNHTDYHSHHFRLVQETGRGRYAVLVRHGGGEERHTLGYSFTRLADILAPLGSDERYLLLHALHNLSRDSATSAREAEREKWSNAAAEGRIRTRKVRNQPAVKVWIDDKAA